MASQFANLGGRRFVNDEFVDEVREAFPTTTKRIPFGFQTYTGWTGKDEVLFTEHDPVVEGMLGKVYEVTYSPDNPDAFDKEILGSVKYTAVKMAALRGEPETGVDELWGSTLDQRMQKEAAAPSGLYGYTKSVQACCEVAARRLNKKAATLIKEIARKDEAVLSFLQTHVKKANSTPAQVLLAAYGESLPKLEAPESPKTAGATVFGMYGFPAKVANRGLNACTAIREAAGVLASSIHNRKRDWHSKVTGFLGEHGKTAQCGASSLILACYPDADFRFRRASTPPTTVEGWLKWDLDETTG